MQNGIFVRSYLLKQVNPLDFSSPKFNSCTKNENMVNSKTNSARKPCQLAQLSMRPCFRGIFGAVDRPDLSKVRLRVAAISLVNLFLLPMAIPPSEIRISCVNHVKQSISLMLALQTEYTVLQLVAVDVTAPYHKYTRTRTSFLPSECVLVQHLMPIFGIR